MVINRCITIAALVAALSFAAGACAQNAPGDSIRGVVTD